MTSNCDDKAECKHYHALIDKRLDRDITPEEDRELENHLATCPSCREEMAAFDAVEGLLLEVAQDCAEAPDGLFESLEAELEEVKPLRGLALLLSLPIFAEQRNRALAMASFALVVILTLGVGKGITDRVHQANALMFADGPSQAMIQTNSGDTIVLSGDEGDPDKYSDALDDLERAYRDAAGEQDSQTAEGYIHTSWKGGEAATPIH
jgi:hypothetical protein